MHPWAPSDMIPEIKLFHNRPDGTCYRQQREQAKPCITALRLDLREPGLWIRKCPALGLISHGTTKECVAEAIFDAIRLSFEDPVQLDVPSDTNRYKIPFSRLIQEGARRAAN